MGMHQGGRAGWRVGELALENSEGQAVSGIGWITARDSGIGWIEAWIEVWGGACSWMDWLLRMVCSG